MKALKNAPVLETEVVAYRFDISDEDQKSQYEEMSQELVSCGAKLMRVYSELPKTTKPVESGGVQIDSSFLFSDQWNTTDDSPSNPNHRIFRWYESIVPNADLRIGHYTVVTDKLRQLLDHDVLVCGYCGSYYWRDEAPGKWCNQCLSSRHLTDFYLPLLLLKPVSFNGSRHDEITEEELADIRYQHNQAWENVRKPQKIQKLEQDFDKKVEKMRREKDGFIAALERDVDIDNCIYYEHQDLFTFGWRHSLSDSEKDHIKQKLADFPYEYSLK